MPCVPKTYCYSLPPTACAFPPRCVHRSSWNHLASPQPNCNKPPICAPIEPPIKSCVPDACCHLPPYPPTTCLVPQPSGPHSSCSPRACPPKCPSCPPIKCPDKPCEPKTCCHSLPYPPATCCLPPPCGPRSPCRQLPCPPPKCPLVSHSRNCPTEFSSQCCSHFNSVKNTPKCHPKKCPDMPCVPKVCSPSLPYPPVACCLPPPCDLR